MEALDRARAVLDLTADWFPTPVDPSTMTAAELALAGLARCRQLLVGMVELYDSSDLTGGFARTLFETYVNSLYLLLGGDDALARVGANDEHQRYKVARHVAETFDRADLPPRLGKRVATMLHRGKPKIRELTFDAMTRKLSQLLEGESAGFPIDGYAVLYGPESYVSVHGGLGAMERHLLARGEYTGMISATWEHTASDHRLDIATMLVASLAQRVGNALGLDTSAIHRFHDEWRADGDFTAE